MRSDCMPSKRSIVSDKDNCTIERFVLSSASVQIQAIKFVRVCHTLLTKLKRSSKQTKAGGTSASHIVSKELFKLMDSNRAHLREWLPFVDDYQSVAAATQFIRRNREENNGRTRLAMGIWVGELLAGVVTYDYIDWSNGAALIGFWLGKAFEGRGIMTRTCRALADLAFDELHLNRVEISCAFENRRCRLVPERLGFKKEGVSRQREWLYDHFVDTVAYSMLSSDWTSRSFEP